MIQLLKTRKTLSVRFASICLSFMVIITSMMTFVLYENDDNHIVKANAADVDTIVETDGPNNEAINTEIIVDIYYDSVIVSPDIYHEDEEMIVSEPIESIQPSEPVEPSETIESSEPVEPSETIESSEPVEPNRNMIDINLLKTPEYLPDYTYGKRVTPSVEIPQIISDNDMRNYIEEVDTTNYLYLGTYSITGYTPKCAHCCGSTKGITASGVEAIVGYTVAADKSIPLGTTLYIEGYGYYVVEDRGNFGSNVIDIAAPTHNSCYNLTNYGVHVYVVPSDN